MGNVFCCHELYNNEIESIKKQPTVAIKKSIEIVPGNVVPGNLSEIVPEIVPETKNPISPTKKDWDFCEEDPL